MATSVLVTGATGFLGKPLCKRLGQNPELEVHAVSRRPPAESSLSKTRIVWHQAYLTSSGTSRALIGSLRPDRIIHLAGQPDGRRTADLILSQFQSNAVPTIELLAASVEFGIGRFILCASMEEPSAPDEIANSPYAASKLTGSLYARMISRTYKLPTVILRTFLTYGPSRQTESKLIPYLIQSLLNGKPAHLSSGERAVDFVYLDDVVDAFVRSLDSPVTDSSPIDIGSGSLVSIREIARLIAGLVGREELLRFDPATDRSDERSPVADLTRAADLLGWTPVTSLPDGLRATIDWYQRRPN